MLENTVSSNHLYLSLFYYVDLSLHICGIALVEVCICRMMSSVWLKLHFSLKDFTEVTTIFLYHVMVVWTKCELLLLLNTNSSGLFTKFLALIYSDASKYAILMLHKSFSCVDMWYLNLTMVVPELGKQSFWADPRWGSHASFWWFVQLEGAITGPW